MILKLKDGDVKILLFVVMNNKNKLSDSDINFIKKKIKKDPETVVVPWMRPQPVAHEQRKALEKEDELKRKLKLDILKVEKFYATTLKNLEKVEDLELKRAIRASVAMGEQEIAVLKKRAKNSSLGFDSVKIVSGENPRFRQPFHEGSKSIQGINSP